MVGSVTEGEQVVIPGVLPVVLEGPEAHIDHTAAAKEGDPRSQYCMMEAEGEEGRPGVGRTDKAEVVSYQNGALVVYDEMK